MEHRPGCENKDTQHNKNLQLGKVVHAFNSSVREIEARGSLGVRGQPGLYSEFLAKLGHIVSLVSKEEKQPHVAGQCLGVGTTRVKPLSAQEQGE